MHSMENLNTTWMEGLVEMRYFLLEARLTPKNFRTWFENLWGLVRVLSLGFDGPFSLFGGRVAN